MTIGMLMRERRRFRSIRPVVGCTPADPVDCGSGDWTDSIDSLDLDGVICRLKTKDDATSVRRINESQVP